MAFTASATPWLSIAALACVLIAIVMAIAYLDEIGATFKKPATAFTAWCAYNFGDHRHYQARHYYIPERQLA